VVPVEIGAAVATADGSDGAGVEIGNQTVRNGTVTVDRVVLPEGGYVVLQSERYVFDGREDPVGNSSYLPPGTHRDVEIELSPRAVRPGATARVAAVAHRDSGGDRSLTRYLNGSDADPPYRTDGAPVADTASITSPSTPTEARTETDPGSGAGGTSSTVTETEIGTGTTSSTGGSDGGGLSPGEAVGAAVGTVLTLLAVLVLATTGRGEP